MFPRQYCRHLLYLILPPSHRLHSHFTSLISLIPEQVVADCALFGNTEVLSLFVFPLFSRLFLQPVLPFSTSFWTKILTKHWYSWKFSKHLHRIYTSHYWGTNSISPLLLCNRHTQINLSSKNFVKKIKNHFERDNMCTADNNFCCSEVLDKKSLLCRFSATDKLNDIKINFRKSPCKRTYNYTYFFFFKSEYD